MMMQVTEGLAVDFEFGWLAPLCDYLVVGLVFGNGHILEHEIAYGIQLFSSLAFDLLELLLSHLDFLFDGISLCLLLLTLVLTL